MTRPAGLAAPTPLHQPVLLLATHLKLRAIAVDANPGRGTLARLSPDERRSERSLADLLEHADRLKTAAEVGPFVSRLPSRLHVLGAPRDPELTATLRPDRYGELVAFLSCFYEVVLLDLGTGVAGPLAGFAIQHADQVMLVTTPEWVTATVVLEALSHLTPARSLGVTSAAMAARMDALPCGSRAHRPGVPRHRVAVRTVPVASPSGGAETAGCPLHGVYRRGGCATSIRASFSQASRSSWLMRRRCSSICNPPRACAEVIART